MEFINLWATVNTMGPNATCNFRVFDRVGNPADFRHAVFFKNEVDHLDNPRQVFVWSIARINLDFFTPFNFSPTL